MKNCNTLSVSNMKCEKINYFKLPSPEIEFWAVRFLLKINLCGSSFRSVLVSFFILNWLGRNTKVRHQSSASPGECGYVLCCLGFIAIQPCATLLTQVILKQGQTQGRCFYFTGSPPHATPALQRCFIHHILVLNSGPLWACLSRCASTLLRFVLLWGLIPLLLSWEWCRCCKALFKLQMSKCSL